MNSLYYQNIVNRIEKEIADLQTKIATRSITKSTSLSMLQSKRKKIERTCLQRFI